MPAEVAFCLGEKSRWARTSNWRPERGNQQARRVLRAARPSGRLLRLLGNVAWRKRGALAEEKIFHVLGDQILRLLLPWHQAVLVQDHLHPLFPELPGVFRDALVDALPELAGP